MIDTLRPRPRPLVAPAVSFVPPPWRAARVARIEVHSRFFSGWVRRGDGVEG